MTDLPPWLQATIQPGSIKEPSSKEISKEAFEGGAEARQVLGVSDLNNQIKNRLEQDFPSLWVKGEISNFTAHRSGHFYFSLKEEQSQVSAVMFKGANSKLRFTPENGMEVIVQAKISVYGPRGTYQLMCQHMEPVGAGALQKSFEQLKLKLKTEGLFDSTHKKALPKFPKKIALITSPTGAAVRDMIHVLSRRAKGVEILLVPAQVQGDLAVKTLLDALDQAERIDDIDVVIIGRGGGSTEDLWAFNHEDLARKIFEFSKPIVSAVGHEIDFTISDFVADMRAPTPSAAAELVVSNAQDVQEKLKHINSRLCQAHKKRLQMMQQALTSLVKRLISPQRFVEQQILRLDELDTRLQQGVKNQISQKAKTLLATGNRLRSPKMQIQGLNQKRSYLESRMIKTIGSYLESHRASVKSHMQMLDSLSPLRVLDRGFAIVKKQGKIVKQAKQLAKKDQIEIQFNDASVSAEVKNIKE